MPRPYIASVPLSPASRALRSRISTICVPLRFGKACASNAAAPLICGAEKEVPLKTVTNRWPSRSVMRTVSLSYSQQIALPSADSTDACDPPARLLKLEMLPPLSTEVAMITLPPPACRMDCAKGLGLSTSKSGSSLPNSLPAETMMTMPPATALRMAVASVLPIRPAPPSDMLSTRAPLCCATFTPVAIERSLKLHPASSPSSGTSAQLPGVSARSARMVALKAMPCTSRLSLAAASTRVTAEPWPSSSPSARLPATSRDSAAMRPANSWLPGSMPVSITPTVTPLPVVPLR